MVKQQKWGLRLSWEPQTLEEAELVIKRAFDMVRYTDDFQNVELDYSTLSLNTEREDWGMFLRVGIVGRDYTDA